MRRILANPSRRPTESHSLSATSRILTTTDEHNLPLTCYNEAKNVIQKSLSTFGLPCLAHPRMFNHAFDSSKFAQPNTIRSSSSSAWLSPSSCCPSTPRRRTVRNYSSAFTATHRPFCAMVQCYWTGGRPLPDGEQARSQQDLTAVCFGSRTGKASPRLYGPVTFTNHTTVTFRLPRHHATLSGHLRSRGGAWSPKGYIFSVAVLLLLTLLRNLQTTILVQFTRSHHPFSLQHQPSPTRPRQGCCQLPTVEN